MSEKLDFAEVSKYIKAVYIIYGLSVFFSDEEDKIYFKEYNEGVHQFTKEYFSVKNLSPLFADDGLSFTLEKVELC